MGKKEPRVDEYIKKAQPFAQPILKHIRELVHKVCPDTEEKWKWSFPHFDYKGGPMCSMAAFKQHCAFGFWKAALMKDAALLTGEESKGAMGSLGRITSLKDLPSDKKLTAWIKEAMKLNDEGVKLNRESPTKHPRKVIVVPDYMTAALKKNKTAFAAWEAFSPSHRREYAEWITEAKTEETRNKRLAQAIEWISEGKGRNWKYAKK